MLHIWRHISYTFRVLQFLPDRFTRTISLAEIIAGFVRIQELTKSRLEKNSERETVFIVGTPEDKGRCSSHPPRNLKSAKSTPSPSPRSSEEPRSQNIAGPRPFDCAWGGEIAVSGNRANHVLQVIALHVPLSMVGRTNGQDAESNSSLLPTYLSPDIRPQFREDSFTLRSRCLVHLDESAGKQVSSSTSSSSNAESVLLFLYEHNNSLPLWQDSWSQRGNDRVREMGPGAWTDFPAYHFFTRVYRPSVVATTVLNRKPVPFCSEQEWLSIPWQRYSKSPFDKLLDIMLQIPRLLQRFDHITFGRFEPSLSFDCKLEGQDLLNACLMVQARLEQWHNSVVYLQSRTAFWVSSDHTAAELPFTNVFAFQDGYIALLLLWYWTAKVSLFPCIELLLSHGLASLPSLPILFTQQSTDNNIPLEYSSPQHQQHQQRLYSGKSITPPPAATAAHLPSLHYSILFGPQKVREIAANICRGLDFALQNPTIMQHDLLAFPAQAVEGFYSGLNVLASAMASTSAQQMGSGGGAWDHPPVVGDAALDELMWLGRFRGRMALRGQEIASMVNERKWVDLAEW